MTEALTTDLVSKLRLVRKHARYEYEKDEFLMIGMVMREAADEIERLRKELRRAMSALVRNGVENMIVDMGADESINWECEKCKSLTPVMLTKCYCCGNPRQVDVAGDPSG